MNLTLILPVAVAAISAPASRPVDLAICLDTSGSMSGLIESAKQKLWAIVNELATAKPAPKLRVALLTYGNDGHNALEGWVEIAVPFTEDLDLVSQKLFALSTNGGTEYVGRVLHRAGGLDWVSAPDALQLAVVAGNEGADQDQQVSFREACKSLIGRGIMVNSFYCGSETDEEAPLWREVALMADGQFACIDMNSGTIVLETPFDTELSTLSSALNLTYIPYGAAGALGVDNQREQDANAAMASPAASAQRCETKAQGIYNCAWDLVDMCRTGQMKLEDVEVAQLPQNMQDMSAEQRAAYIGEMTTKRAGLQAQINELAVKRQESITAQMKDRALDESKSFDHALRQAVREQAATKGFSFPEAAPIH